MTEYLQCCAMDKAKGHSVDCPAQPDMIAHPPHYESHPSGIQPISITRHESFCLGNVIKYCMRAKYKGNEIQDLRKAAQYLQWEIERLENQS